MNRPGRLARSREERGRQERRANPRHPLHPPVVLRLANGAATRGCLDNVCCAGAFVRLKEWPFGLVEGEEGMLGFPLLADTAEHRFGCEIRRVTSLGVAVRFLTGNP